MSTHPASGSGSGAAPPAAVPAGLQWGVMVVVVVVVVGRPQRMNSYTSTAICAYACVHAAPGVPVCAGPYEYEDPRRNQDHEALGG